MKLSTCKFMASNTSIERGSIKDALETMKLIEIIYKADPIWKEKYYNNKE